MFDLVRVQVNQTAKHFSSISKVKVPGLFLWKYRHSYIFLILVFMRVNQIKIDYTT